MANMASTAVRGRALRYRKVAPLSHVDESLFGGSDDDVIPSRSGRVVPRKLSKEHSTGFHEDIVMRENELTKIKLAINPPPPRKRGHSKLEEEPDYAERFAAAQERRKQILATEGERRKNELRKLGRREGPNLTREEALLERHEQRDEVKQINQMILYSKVNSIRHAQIKQKKEIAEVQSAVDKQLDLLMDIDRLRGLQQEEDREQARLRTMREEAELIRNQIAQREAKRELELAERERERHMLLKQMEKLRLEEEKTKTAKEKVKRMLMQEVNNHNANSLKEKEKKLAERQHEDMKIAEYQREKAQREKELEDKKKEVQSAKERELAALHANHERALDKASELDAIRARRAMDERENKERMKEEQEKQRLEKINAELAEARQQQHFEKLQTLAQMAVAEREEFDRVARVQRETEAGERKKREEESLKRLRNAEELQQQIREHQKEKEKRLQEKNEEAIKLKQQQEEDQQQIEYIRAKKLKELEESGVTYTLKIKKPTM